MPQPSGHRNPVAHRLAATLLAAAALLGLSVGAALAQSVACTQLNTMLQSLNSNGDVQNAGQSSQNLRALQVNEANAERAYVRTGCQAQQDQRQPQTPECRGIAQQILTQRAQIADQSQSNNTGVALSRQRQQVLQQLQRYNCASQTSGATFTGNADRQPPQRRNFLQQLFGGADDQGDYGESDSDYTGQQAIEEPEATAPPQNTIRTVCVRMSDAYYWPISYSTTRDYIPQDAATCQAECPDQKVDLYFYANPGQQPQQMVNPAGQSYASLPNAFAYRKQFDLTDSCRPPTTASAVTPPADTAAQPVADAAGAPTAVATADIPLPRPRPDDARAIAALAAMTPAAPPTAASSAPPIATRVVKVGDKLVRVVGPDTPYAPGPPG
jgi:hypothetical protein